MTIFQRWKVEHVQYRNQPCDDWSHLIVDMSESHYGITPVKFLSTRGISTTLTCSFRMFKEMPARGVEVGEARLFKGDVELLRHMPRYTTYTLSGNIFVVTNNIAVVVFNPS